MDIKNLKKQKDAIVGMMDMKPRLSITTKDLPEVKKWKVGKEYDLCLHVKETGVHEDGKELCANFDVLSVEVDDVNEAAD